MNHEDTKPETKNTSMAIPSAMKAMVMETPGKPLKCKMITVPIPDARQVRVKIIACGVCRTDLHIMDSDLNHPKLPLIPGHEIIGIVQSIGSEVDKLTVGTLVGIPWLAHTCGHCRYCLKHQENLCENALFTGYTIDGGYAEYTVAYQEYCFELPAMYGDPAAAPLMCAGLIGFRSYTMTQHSNENLGIYGFGAAAHILIQIARYQGKKVYAFTREGDLEAQAFATKMGAVWAGDSSMTPPVKLDAAIIFAPVGALVVNALKSVDKSGVVVCGGIHMSDIPSFPYSFLWEERMVRSVANLTRQDAREFIAIAEKADVQTTASIFPLEQANEALDALRNGKIQGAAILVM